VVNRALAPERPWRGPAAAPSPFAGRLRDLFEREALPIVVVATWLSLLAVKAPTLLVPDTWLTLVGGRYVAQHGLPHTDSLTFWTIGHSWVDQQWGAQLMFYEAAVHGSLRAALLIGVAAIGLAVVLTAIAARRLGGSSRSVAIAVALPLLGAPWAAEVRAQSLAVPLFVAVYALLAADSRRPGRRVLLTLPLLVLWANLHGSVALGAGLVALYGLVSLRRRETRGRGLVLAATAPLTLLASPYGFDLVGYYRFMLFHPPFARYVTEWQPAAVRVETVLFFATALVGVALWGAHRRRLTPFERWATVLLLIAALAAIRNAVWFEFALAIALPRLLDGAWPSRIELTDSVRRMNLILASVAVAIVLATVGAQAARSSAPDYGGRTPATAAVIAAAAGPRGLVLADEFDSDWLLWEQPSLAGRVAYDVRFELFNARQAREINSLDGLSHPVWARCGSRARVVTFAGERFLSAAQREGVLAQGARVILRSPTLVAVRQPAVDGFCKL
jgi:hypothetical protein